MCQGCKHLSFLFENEKLKYVINHNLLKIWGSHTDFAGHWNLLRCIAAFGDCLIFHRIVLFSFSRPSIHWKWQQYEPWKLWGYLPINVASHCRSPEASLLILVALQSWCFCMWGFLRKLFVSKIKLVLLFNLV